VNLKGFVWVLVPIGVVVLAVVVLERRNPSSPINETASKTAQYIDAKRQLASTLEKALYHEPNRNFRLIPVAGPIYGIGAVLDPNNPADLVTRACLLPPASGPTPDRWTDFPTWDFDRKIDLSTGLPPAVDKALLTASVTLKASRVGSFAVSDLSQQLLARDELSKLLNDADCARATNTNDVIVVRGVVSGREIFRSGQSVAAGAEAHVVDSENSVFRLSYDGNGHFLLEDAKSVPKFLVVSVVEAASRNQPIENSLKAPADSFVQLAERQSISANSQQQ
jgi:hypothetical protein